MHCDIIFFVFIVPRRHGISNRYAPIIAKNNVFEAFIAMLQEKQNTVGYQLSERQVSKRFSLRAI